MSFGESHRRQVATMSRRSFLKSTRLAVAGATALETGLAAMAAAAEPGAQGTAGSAEVAVVGPGPLQIELAVNGAMRRVSVAPSTTLVDALRDQLGLTGTKIGCDHGACSACTIWLDGVPVASCMLLAVDVGDRKVTTIRSQPQAGLRR